MVKFFALLFIATSAATASGSTILGTIRVGHSPTSVAIDERTDTAYVTNDAHDSDSVTVIDGHSGSITTVKDPNANGPYAVAVNPVTDRIYVVNNRSDDVSVITGEPGAAFRDHSPFPPARQHPPADRHPSTRRHPTRRSDPA